MAMALAAGPVAAHGAVPLEAPDLASIVLDWSFKPLVAIPMILVALIWLTIVDRVGRLHPDHPVSRWRTAAFFGGLASIAIALMSGVEAYDTTLFSIHMVQHMLLTFAAAPLLVLAAPVTQLLRAASPEARRRWILPILHSRPVAVLAHPVVTWLAFTVVMWATHFSPLFDLALEEPFVHDLEHALFLGSALLFWWPVVGADPAPRRMGYPARALYLLLQMPPNSFLAVAILLATAPLYPHYATLGSPYGIDALADQQLAAGLMWVTADMVFIGAILLVVAAWMRREERDAPAAERRAARERQRIDERADALAARTARGAPMAVGPRQAGEPSSGGSEASRPR
jgi:putative membrane protein